MAPRLAVLAAAVLMSTGGAAIKASQLSGIEIAAVRSIIAAAVLLGLTRARKGPWGPRTLAVGSIFAAMMILYVVANKLTTAANTIFLQAAAPLYVLLAAPRMLGEPVRRRDVPYMVALALGLALFFSGPTQAYGTAPRPVLGNVLAVLGGVMWAATILGLRWLASGAAARQGARGPASAASAIFLGNVLTFLVGLPWILRHPADVLGDSAVLVYLGVFQVGLAYVLFDAGVRRVPAFETSLLLLLEPVLNPLWAWIVHAETPGVRALAGGALIIGVTALKTVCDAFAAHTSRSGNLTTRS